jgi:alpha-beta hydrolase superfamily lysophospholipase
MEKASESSSRLRVPTACLYGAKDQIIPRPSAEKAARALPEGARTAVYPNGYHMLLRDPQAQVVWDDVLSFLKDPAAPFPSGAAPLLAGKRDR